MRNEWSFQHKKRRQEQMRLWKKGLPAERTWGKEVDFYKEHPTPELAPWNQTTWKQRVSAKGKKKFQTQLIVTMMLFALTFLVFRSQSPAMHPVQAWMTDSLTKETAFTRISEWFERYAGGSPAILPAFLPGKKSASQPQEVPWLIPVRGELVLPFDEKRKGLILRTAPHASVRAARDGWVTFADEKKGMGRLVVVKHANGQETWYGWLQEIKVKQKDWIKRGQVIGSVPEMKEQAYFYFALKKQQQFVDPADVIPFE
ncbi:peptidoglycan DD-metalloendopeptidase family protein [Laceyella putida]|uniref:Peptidoglycan DD-metalloendopeptidase family protein n=1 Tax=Laceyella putida TaxID=110101 RepID=A0ABW2RIP1_9BACL